MCGTRSLNRLSIRLVQTSGISSTCESAERTDFSIVLFLLCLLPDDYPHPGLFQVRPGWALHLSNARLVFSRAAPLSTPPGNDGARATASPRPAKSACRSLLDA